MSKDLSLTSAFSRSMKSISARISVICKENAEAKTAPSASDVGVLKRSKVMLLTVMMMCMPFTVFTTLEVSTDSDPAPSEEMELREGFHLCEDNDRGTV